MNLEEILSLCPSILAAINLVLLLFTLKKYLQQPHDTMIERIARIEEDVKELKGQQEQDRNKFKDQQKQDRIRFKEQMITNEVIIKSVLALIEFEIQYCITENKEPTDSLELARKDLNAFLSKRGTEREYEDI